MYKKHDASAKLLFCWYKPYVFVVLVVVAVVRRTSLLKLLIVLIPKFYYVILLLSILTEIKLFRVQGFLLHRLYSNKKPSAKLSIQRGGGSRGSYFPYILLNEIQTMLSQVVKLTSKVLIADLFFFWSCALRQVLRINGFALRRNKIIAVEGGTVSPYFI